MATLPSDLRNQLERTVIAARNLAEKAAKSALEAMAVQHHEPYGHMTPEQRKLRNHLRARARQVGDTQDTKGILAIKHLAHECAYEHWHRMLFARFLAENNLLIEPDTGVAISLDECKELAKEAKTDLWTLAGRYAQRMLPQIFRADDPLLQVTLAKEDQLKLEKLLDGLPSAVYTASDALGWCYQFWQSERKKQVNDSGVKIGADELPAVTQLFTEDYMVDFLLDNTLGAWWAGKVLIADPKLSSTAKAEEELRKAVSLPGIDWKYLRFVKDEDGHWQPAAGTFEGWPKTAKELKCLDPCMGSGHFIVAMFVRLVALRTSEEKLSEKAAVEAVIQDNLYGLEIDQRCTQLAAFNLAFAAWKRIGYRSLPLMHLACSGLGVVAKKDEWLALAKKSDKLRAGMERLYQHFQKAPVLGSLINPRLGGDLLTAEFHDLQPLMDQALKLETTDDTHEMAVTAKGVAEAAEILAEQFTLVATNVPYLARGKYDASLKAHIESHYSLGRENIASVFVLRCLELCAPGGTASLVTLQTWLFLTSYKLLREALLRRDKWVFIAGLGTQAFSTPLWDFHAMLIAISKTGSNVDNDIITFDASTAGSIEDKADLLQTLEPNEAKQIEQLSNPEACVRFDSSHGAELLSKYASFANGIQTSDRPRFVIAFWETPNLEAHWAYMQSTVQSAAYIGGLHYQVRWDRELKMIPDAHGSVVRGTAAWERPGVCISAMGDLAAALYSGQLYDENCVVLIPNSNGDLRSLWVYCSSEQFNKDVRSICKALKVRRHLVAISFDNEYWQKKAAEEYPHGLPKPQSDDPTQWLFNGHPQGSGQPLHVAVARLLDYRWPRQTGSSFPHCPALKSDGLEKLADKDGIVCIPSVRGEEPAADRLRKLLAAAYGKDWKPTTELELIKATGSNASDLDEWLRSEFFEQHCDLFHQRPFIWHIWDGRKRDGFHALVNYHKLAADGGKGRKTLEALTHSYLNDWISRQKDGVKREEEGSEERLAAAQALKERLESIIDGESPFDVFVRWKPIAKQAIGWEPDINDGVRMNIRPLMASDLPNGKKGAGILRSKPKVKWDKDRGMEPERPKAEYPWFWNGGKFTGDRLNDVHLKIEQKQKARKS